MRRFVSIAVTVHGAAFEQHRRAKVCARENTHTSAEQPMIPKKILVPTDYSDTAEHGTRYAFELAQALGAKVSLLHVYAIPVPPEAGGMASDFVRETQQEAEKQLQYAAAKYQGSGLLAGTQLVSGDASEAILSTAREIGADLIIIGTHGRSGVRRMLLGSVAETVLRRAPCPVLAIRDPSAH
jgi:nucleotide-binding universal stress UspA family protein